MFIYIVEDSDDGTIDSIYDEETFKIEYEKYLNSSKQYWHRIYNVYKLELNKSYEHSYRHWIYPEDIKKLNNI